jgi:hypothetical protein
LLFFTLPETVEETNTNRKLCLVRWFVAKHLPTTKERFCAREENNKAEQTAAIASARKTKLFP